MTARAVAATLVTVAITATAGCGGATVQPAGGASLDGDWRLVTATLDGEALDPRSEAPVTLVIDGTAVSGTSACNAYSGILTADGDETTFGELGGTEMACEPDVMALETAYLQALGRVTRAAGDTQGVSMLGDRVELTFEPIPAEPALPLIGTRWVLEAVTTTGSADASASSPVGRTSTIEFTADGQLSGDTGCNGFGSAWSEVDGRIETADVARTLIGCDSAVAAQEQHVMAVINGPFTVAINGNQLTLALADGSGLVYRVDETAPTAASTSG